MLHHVYHLSTKCVCLLFGADRLAYSGFLEHFSWKHLPAEPEKWHYPNGESAPKQYIYNQLTKLWKAEMNLRFGW